MNDDNRIPAENSPSSTNSYATRPRRFRFSLATLMLSVTLAVVLIALWATSRKCEQMMAELKKYRQEYGYLAIKDPSCVHAVGVQTNEEREWRWRIHLPEKRRYRIHARTGNIPKNGFPGPTMELCPGPGEFLMIAKVLKNQEGFWILRIDCGLLRYLVEGPVIFQPPFNLAPYDGLMIWISEEKTL